MDIAEERHRRHGRLLTLTGWHSGRTPAWVMLPQLFLAAGWMRVGLANGVTEGWWSGDAVRRFVETDTALAVSIYEPFLSGVIVPMAIVIAAVVCIAELAIAVMLALNHRVPVALAVGMFLNVQFMLAGAVNPSAFYLVLAMVIVLWRLENSLGTVPDRPVAHYAWFAAAVITLGLAPFVTTVHPSRVIEDPAIVLIFLSLLFAVATWSLSDNLAAAGGEHHPT